MHTDVILSQRHTLRNFTRKLYSHSAFYIYVFLLQEIKTSFKNSVKITLDKFQALTSACYDCILDKVGITRNHFLT